MSAEDKQSVTKVRKGSSEETAKGRVVEVLRGRRKGRVAEVLRSQKNRVVAQQSTEQEEAGETARVTSARILNSGTTEFWEPFLQQRKQHILERTMTDIEMN